MNAPDETKARQERILTITGHLLSVQHAAELIWQALWHQDTNTKKTAAKRGQEQRGPTMDKTPPTPNEVPQSNFVVTVGGITSTTESLR